MPEKTITQGQAEIVEAWMEGQRVHWLVSVSPDHIRPAGAWTVNDEALVLAPRVIGRAPYSHTISCSDNHAKALQREGIISFR